MDKEYNVEEQLAKIQFKLLGEGFSLEHHLETVKELPTEIKLKHYEKLFQENWINQKQYLTYLLENNPLLLQ